MVLLLFAALGCGLGYHYHTTRTGYAVLAMIALLFPLLQIADVVFVRERSAQTMLPLIIGMIMVLSTILGAGTRLYSIRSN
jgi:hypothetical protein